MSWYNNNTVSRHVSSYTPKYERCTGTYIFESKEPGSALNIFGSIASGDFRPVKCIWHKYRCDTCGRTYSSTSRQQQRYQCSHKYDIANPNGINILCRKENDGVFYCETCVNIHNSASDKDKLRLGVARFVIH